MRKLSEFYNFSFADEGLIVENKGSRLTPKKPRQIRQTLNSTAIDGEKISK